MTEEMPATPGWTDDRLDAAFAGLPRSSATEAARRAYEDCLAARKAPAAPSDLLGAEFEGCASALRRALLGCGVDAEACDALLGRLEAVEADIARDS